MLTTMGEKGTTTKPLWETTWGRRTGRLPYHTLAGLHTRLTTLGQCRDIQRLDSRRWWHNCRAGAPNC